MSTLTTLTTEKKLYRNARDHTIGVTLIGVDGKPGGTPLRGNERVWMSEQERVLTANAPVLAENNPFVNGDLEEVDLGDRVADINPTGRSIEPVAPEAAQEPQEEVVPPPAAPPIKEPVQLTGGLAGEDDPVTPPEQEKAPLIGEETAAERHPHEETGAAVEPAENPPEGAYAADEEVATPDAPARTAE